MSQKRKRGVLLVAGVAVVAIVLLSASFSDLELAPGQFLPRHKDAEVSASLPAEPVSNTLAGPLYAVLYFLIVALIPFSILYLIISPEARRRVLRGLGLLLWLLAFALLIRASPDFFERLQERTDQTERTTQVLLREVQFASNPPWWLVWGVTIGLALLSAVVIVWTARSLWLRTRRPENSLAQLAQEVQQALDALHAGADLQDVVLRCYFEMSRVLQEQRGLRREEAMTPREFEQSLARAGLPAEQVRQLTRLFEDVRYGAHSASHREERQADDCLTAIVAACRGTA